MARLFAFLSCAAFVLIFPVCARAQVKDGFVEALLQFADAAASGIDEGPRLTAAVEAMAQGLAEWDAGIGRMEAGLRSEIANAPPPIAARMRTALGAAYLERGRIDEALAQFDEAARLDPLFGDVHVLRGLTNEQANRPADAAAAYRSAWEKQPENMASAYRALQAAGGSNDALVAAATQALSTAVERAVPVERSATAFVTPSLLDEGSVTSPLFLPGTYANALALVSQGKYGEAVAAFREAVTTDARRLEARDERSRLLRADVLFESGDAGGARQTLSELLQAVPASAQGYWKLGRMQQTLGDQAAALQSFQAASALPRLAGGSHLFAAIGRIQHNQLDLEGAASAYRRRTALTPNDAAAHIDLGDVYLAQDRLDIALVEYLVASLLEPASVRALAGAAQVHVAAGREEAAVRLLRRAVALDPAHREARYALGRALMRLGLADEARRELQTFSELQQRAMEDERRRFQENQIKIDETLKAGDREPTR